MSSSILIMAQINKAVTAIRAGEEFPMWNLSGCIVMISKDCRDRLRVSIPDYFPNTQAQIYSKLEDMKAEFVDRTVHKTYERQREIFTFRIKVD